MFQAGPAVAVDAASPKLGVEGVEGFSAERARFDVADQGAMCSRW